MSTTETKIGKHDILCSSLNFATPEGAAECDCNLSVMADMLEALEDALEILEEAHIPATSSAQRAIRSRVRHWKDKASAAIAKAKGGAA